MAEPRSAGRSKSWANSLKRYRGHGICPSVEKGGSNTHDAAFPLAQLSSYPSLIAVAVAQVSEIPHSAGLDGLREERVRHRDDFCHSVGASVSLCQFDDFSRLMNEGLGEVIKSRAEKWRRKTQFRLAIAELEGLVSMGSPDPRKAKLVSREESVTTPKVTDAMAAGCLTRRTLPVGWGLFRTLPSRLLRA